ncbi:MAG: polymer-forming cytoskeletal protein [Bryobacterales bacterium]|nr:polymer-forming cytoskeletal protein [Bryobacterales bacterium]MDE0260998.1 polymer-forming cytoskeletal protein [Bryobacterales bacterium]MDE0620147.1 polymer-forming cytoskeletal protein [Bryobacterales bacterium]
MASISPSVSNQNSGSRLGRTTRLVGDIVADEPLLIAGKFKGSIESKSNEVIVAEHAEVEADIVAAKVSVSGRVKGNVTGLKGARFTGTAVMTGKLTTTSEFVVEKGALFRGQVDYMSEGKNSQK